MFDGSIDFSSNDGLIVRICELSCDTTDKEDVWDLLTDVAAILSQGGDRVVTTWVTSLEKNFSSLW